ncbi:hypothetical protein U91I_00795 [alpha proteobacterium U9-1i]|nr:hypothetical protein U91I_00795 [alpha proteobacterium U9-1i]
MRNAILALGLLLAACATPQVTRTTLVAADAATSLIVGERLTQEVSTLAGSEGNDAVVNLTLRHADGRTLAFQEANHSPHDLIVQAAGGALAQVMGAGEEVTTLYHAASGEGETAGAPFLCGPQGPAALGIHRGADGTIRMVGLRQPFQVETTPSGQDEVLPYSPDQVCARLSFRAQ